LEETIMTLRTWIVLGLGCALAGAAMASDLPQDAVGGQEEICPVYTGVVEATVFDTRLVDPQIQGGWPWEGPISIVRDHLPPHEGEGELAEGAWNHLVPGGLADRPVGASLGGGFPGISQTRWTPPDPTATAGPNHIVTTVNSTMAFYSKAGQLQFSVILDNTGNPGFFEDVGAGNFVVDPKVLYDHRAGRFVVLAIEVYSGSSAWLDIAVSDDSDPHGVWYKYRTRAEVPVGSADYWVDYPSFGYDDDAYYSGGNLFRLRGSGPSTSGVLCRVYDKTPMLSGSPTTYNDLVYTTSFSAQAALHYGGNVAGFYASVNNTSSIRLYAVRDPVGSPSLVTTTVNVPPFTPASRYSAPNRGANVDPLDGRVFTVQWRNGNLYTGHAINVGGVNKARWYHFDTGNWPDSGSPTLVQSGNVDPGSGIHTYFPALFENAAGDVGMVFARSSSNEYVSVQITGRHPNDPPGTMAQPTQLFIGDAAGSGRWGDYYSIAIDPNDDLTFWIIGEYQKAGVGWATWIESFSLSAVIQPLDFTVTRGELIGGDLADLFASDDEYVEVDARRPTEIAANSVEVEFTSAVPSEAPATLQFIVETGTGGAPSNVNVAFFNYDSAEWDVLLDRGSSQSDETITVTVDQNTGRYIQNGTREVKSRVGYSDRGVTFPAWGGRFDMAGWTLVE
jgi:hypothetical protein